MAQRNRDNAPVTSVDWSLQAYKTVVFDGLEFGGDNTSAAFATITSTGVAPADGATVTIGAGDDERIYVFKTILSVGPAVPYEVLIGISAATALDNLKSAVDKSAGEGTTYATGTVAHPTVSGSTNTDTTQLFVADTAGPAGNAISVAETSNVLTWGVGVTTLSGGSDGTVPLFTVTGTVLMRLLAKCTESLAGASATIEAGTALSTAALIAQTTATDIDVNEIWHDGTPDASIEATTVLVQKIVSDSVRLTIGTAPITDGTIGFTCMWYPLSDDANVVAA